MAGALWVQRTGREWSTAAMTHTSDSGTEHTTVDDEWSALDGSATLWRGLDAWQVNIAAAIRKARAQVQAGQLDVLGGRGLLAAHR